ncbi:MAG TPA: type II toxin-antitoxin system RelE/ParE family toxin [Tepidisphaeraceae bacterium]|jgi:toxin ParE1/3/4|nr:type II toxin-antitoxin system RelE/ParE family toxin [Tepidisphaeraceae bacterium]
MSRYTLTGPATRDIDEILDYIAAQSVQNATIVAKRFAAAFERISKMPGIGHKRDELKDRNARILFVSGYLVIYDPFPIPVAILRVVRGTRNLSRISIRE